MIKAYGLSHVAVMSVKGSRDTTEFILRRRFKNRNGEPGPVAFIPCVVKDRHRNKGVMSMHEEGLERLFCGFRLSSLGSLLFASLYRKIRVVQPQWSGRTLCGGSRRILPGRIPKPQHEEKQEAKNDLD